MVKRIRTSKKPETEEMRIVHSLNELYTITHTRRDRAFVELLLNCLTLNSTQLVKTVFVILRKNKKLFFQIKCECPHTQSKRITFTHTTRTDRTIGHMRECRRLFEIGAVPMVSNASPLRGEGNAWDVSG